MNLNGGVRNCGSPGILTRECNIPGSHTTTHECPNCSMVQMTKACYSVAVSEDQLSALEMAENSEKVQSLIKQVVQQLMDDQQALDSAVGNFFEDRSHKIRDKLRSLVMEYENKLSSDELHALMRGAYRKIFLNSGRVPGDPV
jgi:hypothetical protein